MKLFYLFVIFSFHSKMNFSISAKRWVVTNMKYISDSGMKNFFVLGNQDYNYEFLPLVEPLELMWKEK